ncbi:MAG: hypothetical protein CMG67_03120 [Candidatus Marinimicrobia bacterium]|nr:hypothetical protein [Candidatus Neomarinimicrobiota bacterium]|tara:strand:- start:1301 stop:1501 length:201 start_codon:yes stop_codon:yes gene_type:complete
MDLKDKLNLAWKFIFLAVFTYGVISLTCCSSSCCDTSASCGQAKQCSKSAPVAKQCGTNCAKACCA